jgi:hypothetical protein
MKKISIIIVFILLAHIGLHSLEGNTYYLIERNTRDPFQFETIGSLSFEQHYFILKIQDGSKTFQYKVVEESGLQYIKYGPGYTNKWLVLYTELYIFIYENNDKLLYEGYFPTPDNSFQFVPGHYAATSFLVEGSIHYSPANLGVYNVLKKPWANAGSRYAINEYIQIKFDEVVDKLIISNGFVCYSKPDLFFKNSRIKSIIIFDADTNEKLKEFELRDTANLHVVHLNHGVRNIKIKITDVYKGTTYKDTCINFIIGEHFVPADLGPQGSDVY